MIMKLAFFGLLGAMAFPMQGGADGLSQDMQTWVSSGSVRLEKTSCAIADHGGYIQLPNLYSSGYGGVIQKVRITSMDKINKTGLKLLPMRSYFGGGAAQPIELANPYVFENTMTYIADGLGSIYHPDGTTGYFALAPVIADALVCVTVVPFG